ncbi:MAG: AAA family ATPase [Dehalococcoidia bacterium]|nr:AAA family ATPase [Dehalococcoidia bacterium]
MQPTLMVIDDDPDTRRFLREMLIEEGHPVSYDGGHGLAGSHAAREFEPDIVFAAIEDPVPRAMLTVDFIRDLLPGSVVIGYTTTPTPEIARRAMRSDIHDLLDAPLVREDVRQAIASAMRALERNGRLDPAGGHVGGVFSVVGQKGGIGKTTIATNLASVLASRTPASTIIIDLDTRFGDVALAMDVPYEFTAANAARGIGSLDREEFRSLLVQHESGAMVLPSPESPREWVDVPPQASRS